MSDIETAIAGCERMLAHWCTVLEASFGEEREFEPSKIKLTMDLAQLLSKFIAWKKDFIDDRRNEADGKNDLTINQMLLHIEERIHALAAEIANEHCAEMAAEIQEKTCPQCGHQIGSA